LRFLLGWGVVEERGLGEIVGWWLGFWSRECGFGFRVFGIFEPVERCDAGIEDEGGVSIDDGAEGLELAITSPSPSSQGSFSQEFPS